VIDADRNAGAARGVDELGRLLDRFGTAGVVMGRGIRLAAAAAPRTVNGGARFAKHPGDPAPGAARGPGDDGDVSFEWLHEGGL
jgi:hypothetical protein